MKNQKELRKGQNMNLIFKFESEIPVCLDDKFVIRSYSPMQTIGGGIVLNTYVDNKILKYIDIIPLDPKKRFIFFLESGWEHSTTLNNWKKLFFKVHDKIENWCEEFDVQITNSNILFSLYNIEKGMVKVQSFLKKFHVTNSLKSGVSMETISSSMGWHQDFLKSVIKALIQKKQIRKVNELKNIPYFLESKQVISKLQIKQIDNKFLKIILKILDWFQIEKTSDIENKKV